MELLGVEKIDEIIAIAEELKFHLGILIIIHCYYLYQFRFNKKIT